MSEQQPWNLEQVEKPEPDSGNNIVMMKNETVIKKQGTSIFPQALIEQLAFDPVEKGPYISVDNSPRSGRNVGVIKAKLREQESRHTLEIVRIKKEHELREESLTSDIAGLRSSVADLQTQVDTELKVRKDAERREEQTSKDLLIISGKCGELQGRLDESHAALQESREYIKTLKALNEEKLTEINKNIADSEQKYQDEKKALERKNRDVEEQLVETRASFQKVLTEKQEQWKAREAELTASIQQEESRYEKICEEKASEMEKVVQLQIQLKNATEGRENIQLEINELKDYHRLELNQIQEDHANSQRQWDERMENVLGQLRQVQDELDQTKSARDELIVEKENTMKKDEESIKVLKGTLTVVDEQNKELTSELKRIQDKCEEKETVSATLASQVNTLLVERDAVHSENQKLLVEKSKLEEEVTHKSQTISDITMQKDSEMLNLQEELASVKTELSKELEEKKVRIVSLEADLESLKESMENGLQAKDDKIQELSRKLEEEKRTIASRAADFDGMKQSVLDYTEQIDELNARLEGSKLQVAKLNLEMSRLINEVVNIKEENIHLKTGLNEALQKGEFYKDRNFSLTEQLAQIQREKVDTEAELTLDIQEKRALIEYLQNQASDAATGSSEKKKRRFFQTKTLLPSSPMKVDLQKVTNDVPTSVHNDDPPSDEAI